MRCLGIESTAHTFACSIINLDNNSKQSIARLLSDIRDTYIPSKGSGIHPREASRHHGQVAHSVLLTALKKAGSSIKDVDVIAYSAGPGLGPCLRVGAVVARTLATYYKKALLPVNHALGHIELGAVLTGASDPIVLLVSGGHTMILAFSQKRWRIFGETLDITLGQLLDQFGRCLGFASPCGDQIESLAEKSGSNFSQLPYVVKGNDVSFSGLLTAAIQNISKKKNSIQDLCYSLQETAFAMTTEALERAVSFTSKSEVLVVGGVAANKRLREMIEGACNRQGVKFRVCPPKFAGDNGVQIAWVALLDNKIHQQYIPLEGSFVNQAWRVDSIDVNWRDCSPLTDLSLSVF